MNGRWLVVIPALGATVVAAPALAYQGGSTSGYGMMWSAGWASSPLGWLLTFACFALLLVLAFAALHRSGASRRHAVRAEPVAGKSALAVLEERFARGEVGRAEYEEKKRLLSD